MTSVKFDIAKEWFEKLRDQLVLSLEKIEMNKFTITD